MSFTEDLFPKLDFLFSNYRLKINEQRSDVLCIANQCLEFRIIFNARENSYYLLINDKEKGSTVEIDNKTLSDFFKSDIKLSEVTREIFIDNLLKFFKLEEKKLLDCDMVYWKELQNYSAERSRIYTQQFTKR